MSEAAKAAVFGGAIRDIADTADLDRTRLVWVRQRYLQELEKDSLATYERSEDQDRRRTNLLDSLARINAIIGNLTS